jgi:serine/threonine protein kinase
MGVVYLAERKDLGNVVAIKILRDAWLSPSRLKRFETERRTLARLNHPLIARLYDAATLPNGTPWFAMEYVDGVALNKYCESHNCSIEERLKLVRSICEAVQYAHDRGVIHRDLKPSNILVKEDGSVRLLDFGIAKQLDADGQPTDRTRITLRPMTPAYAAPEQLRGDAVGVQSDVYSLGVILYELLAGRLPFDVWQKTPPEAAAVLTTEDPAKPSLVARRGGMRTGSWMDLDVLCLAAMQKDPARRYRSVQALIHDLDHYLKHEPLEARPDSPLYTLGKFLRRNWRSVATGAAMLTSIGIAIAPTMSRFSKGSGESTPRTVAVIPFENAGSDSSLNFLKWGLADEISATLGYARSLTVRLPEQTHRYTGSNPDLAKTGRELRVAHLVSGRFFQAGDQLQITLRVTDVEKNRLLWEDVFDVPARNMIAMQAQIAAKTRRGLAPLLGTPEFVTETPPKPKNEDAYKLVLEARSIPGETDPELNRRATDMLKRAVQLDPTYAQAWEDLSARHLADVWFRNGGQSAIDAWWDAGERAAGLDPANVIFRAAFLYMQGSIGKRAKRQGITRGEAYRRLEELIRLRPDSGRLHFDASWMLRDAGLLDESARECETSLLIDAQDSGARSCGVTFMLLGNYRRAMDYLRLDLNTQITQAVSIDVLLHQGKQKAALKIWPDLTPQWGGYRMLLAYLQHRPSGEIATLARAVQPVPDPEMNYFSAAHLAYAGEPDAALPLLKEAVDGGYCSYPAMDSDTFLASARSRPGFREIRSAGMACRDAFLSEAGGNAPARVPGR